MNHQLFNRFTLSFLLVSGVIFHQNSFAQEGADNKKTTIRIKATEDKDGRIRNIEKKYRVAEMSEEQRQEFIDKAVDSLNIAKENRRSLSITVDDGDQSTVTSNRRRRIIDHPEHADAMAFSWADDFAENFDSEKFRSHMRNFEREFKPKARIVMKDMENFGDRMGDFWTKEIMKPSTVRDLNVYANNPDNGVLNLRFKVPQKGDVSISVTDTRGKEVAKKEIKDFSGDFVGQVEVKKNTKGTLFVTVIQNEDGATRRVVVP